MGTGWDEGILGSGSSAPMSLGEKATLTISAYVKPHWLPTSSLTIPPNSDYGYGSR